MGAEESIAVRNDRDAVQFPVMGLQEAGGNLSKLLSLTFAAGKFRLSPAQCDEVRDRLVDLLGCLARICGETATLAETLAAHTASQLNARAEGATEVYELANR